MEAWRRHIHFTRHIRASTIFVVSSCPRHLWVGIACNPPLWNQVEKLVVDSDEGIQAPRTYKILVVDPVIFWRKDADTRKILHEEILIFIVVMDRSILLMVFLLERDFQIIAE